MFGLVDVLERCGFDKTVKTRLVRHQDASRYDVHRLRREGWFEHYQRFQTTPVFKDARQIVAFVGAGGTRARLVGVYRVRGENDPRSLVFPSDFPYPEWPEHAGVYYDLELDPAYEPLRDRVVIEWGKGARAWVQKLSNKEVVEILPEGRVREPFDDYHEFSLTHAELRGLCKAPEANAEWRARLSAVAGIYLITAETTGHHYIGSAHGAAGIWARWSQYARNGHGGNRKLREIVANDEAYPSRFRYSVLHVLPPSTTHAEVLRWESIYKEKLGSRAIGLNLN